MELTEVVFSVGVHIDRAAETLSLLHGLHQLGKDIFTLRDINWSYKLLHFFSSLDDNVKAVPVVLIKIYGPVEI